MNRIATIQVRVSPDEKKAIIRECQRQNFPDTSTFIRKLTLDEVNKHEARKDG